MLFIHQIEKLNCIKIELTKLNSRLILFIYLIRNMEYKFFTFKIAVVVHYTKKLAQEVKLSLYVTFILDI